jgi:hypothetical protein
VTNSGSEAGSRQCMCFRRPLPWRRLKRDVVHERPSAKRRLLQFKLKTLLLAVSVAAVVMALWRAGGPGGVALVAGFVLPPIGLAWIGARPGQPILLGAAGGGWTAAAFVVGVLCLSGPDAPLYLGPHLAITLAGVALGAFFGALRHVWLTRKDRWAGAGQTRFVLRRHAWRLGIVLSIGAVATFLLGRWIERRLWTDPSARAVNTSTWYTWVHTCELAGYGVDDAELADVIAGLPKKYWHIRLIFYHTQVTDEGVALLKDVPNLYSVDLRGTQASKQAVAALREAQPDCKIRW